jgi:hypothetical protein
VDLINDANELGLDLSLGGCDPPAESGKDEDDGGGRVVPTSHRRVTRTDFDTHACLKKSPRARPLTHARTEALYLASLQARGSKHFFFQMAHKGRSARRLGAGPSLGMCGKSDRAGPQNSGGLQGYSTS